MFLERARLFSSAALAFAVLAACGGSTSSMSGSSGNVAPAVHHLKPQTSAPSIPALSNSRISMDRDGRPRWDFYDPLTIANDGTFAVVSWYTRCYPTTALLGPWYYSDAPFSLQNLTSVLPACTLHDGRNDEPDALKPMAFQTVPPTPTPSPTSTPGGSTGDLYIVRIDVSWSGIEVGAIAGPAQVTATQWQFPPLVNPQSFKNGHFYEFYVANYLDTVDPVPTAQ